MNEKKIWDKYWTSEKEYVVKKDPLYKEVLNILPKNKGSLIPEAGCGDGKWLFYFNKIGYKNVVGLDFSDVGLKKIRKISKDAMLIKGDIRNLPIKDKSFETVFSFGVIEHFKKPEILINEMYRILGKNGKIFLDTPNLLSLHTFYRFYRRLRGKWVVGYEDYYTVWQLKRMLKKTGFKIIKSGVRGKYNKLDIFKFLSFVAGKK